MEEGSSTVLQIFLLGGLGAGIIALAIYLSVLMARGVAALWELAITQGFLGFAAFLACWVFMFPVMVVVSVLVGIANRRPSPDERRRSHQAFMQEVDRKKRFWEENERRLASDPRFAEEPPTDFERRRGF